MNKNLRRAAILSLAVMAGGFIGQAAQADPIRTVGSDKSQGSSLVSAVQSEVNNVTYDAGDIAGRAVYFAKQTFDNCGACQGLSGVKPPPLPTPPAPVTPDPNQKLPSIPR